MPVYNYEIKHGTKNKNKTKILHHVHFKGKQEIVHQEKACEKEKRGEKKEK